MTKAELEREYEQFNVCAKECASFHSWLRTRDALTAARESLRFADGMLQYSRRYIEGSLPRVTTADYILNVAPIVFDTESLDSLNALVSQSRRVARGDDWDYADGLSHARLAMEDARRLWINLDTADSVPLAKLSQITWSTPIDRIIFKMKAINILEDTPGSSDQSIRLATNLQRLCSAKCAECGAVCGRSKSIFLEEMTCQACGAGASFVVMG